MKFEIQIFLYIASLLCASYGAAILERQEIDESTNSTESSTTAAATTAAQSSNTAEIEFWPLCDYPLWPIEIWEDPVPIEYIDPVPQYVELPPPELIVWPEFEEVFYP